MILGVVDRLQYGVLRLAGFRPVRAETAVGPMCALDWRGDGPLGTLVVQHGIAAAGVDLMPLLLRLRGAFSRILVPDLPAHGASPAPDAFDPETLRIAYDEALTAWIEHPAILFGNSLGGVCAIRFSLAHPDRVRALFLCSPGGATESEEALSALKQVFELAGPRARAFVESLHGRPPWYASLIAPDVRRRFAAAPIQNFLAALDVTHLVTPDELAALGMPLMMLWGERDRVLPRHHLDFYKHNLPAHATVVEPAGMGHCPYLDRSRALAQYLLRFSRSL